MCTRGRFPSVSDDGLASIDDGTIQQSRVCAICTDCTISGFMIDRYGRTCYNCGVADDTAVWTREMCMDLLLNGTIDAIIDDRPPAVYKTNTLLDSEGRCFLEVVGDPFYVLGYVFKFPSSCPLYPRWWWWCGGGSEVAVAVAAGVSCR